MPVEKAPHDSIYHFSLHILAYTKHQDSLAKPELFFLPRASPHYPVCILLRQMIQPFCQQGLCVGICLYAAHKPARGNYSPCASRRWSTPTCSLCSDITWQSLFVCCQQPGQLLSAPAHPGERDVPTQGRTTFTPVFHHHLTAHLLYKHFASHFSSHSNCLLY